MRPSAEMTAAAVSPVTLSSDWSGVTRLLLLICLAVIGSVGNVFMISSVMIEDHLKKKGNSFIVNVALADLLITGLVIPASAIVILAGQQGSLSVCKFQWFLAALCFLVTSLMLGFTALENYIRLCGSQWLYDALTPTKITLVALLSWLVCTVASGLQFVSDLSFDYCTRTNSGLIPYQLSVAVVLVFLPILLALVCYALVVCRVRALRAHPNFKPPISFGWDYSLMKTNACSFLLFIAFWLPFGLVLVAGPLRSVSDYTFYNLAWFAISKSCVNNILYCAANTHFRNAYVNLFNYCCCRTTVSFSRRQRGEPARPTGDVRVHIIPGYNMYSYTSPQRGSREGTAKRSAGCYRPSTSRPSCGSRDVYEL